MGFNPHLVTKEQVYFIKELSFPPGKKTFALPSRYACLGELFISLFVCWVTVQITPPSALVKKTVELTLEAFILTFNQNFMVDCASGLGRDAVFIKNLITIGSEYTVFICLLASPATFTLRRYDFLKDIFSAS